MDVVLISALLGSTLPNSHLADKSDPCQHPGRSPDDYDQDDDPEDEEHSGFSRDDNGHDEDKDEDDDPVEHPGGSQAEPRLWSATR